MSSRAGKPGEGGADAGSSRLPDDSSTMGAQRLPSRASRADTELPGAARSALDEFLFHLSLVRAASDRTVEAYAGDIRALFRHLARGGIAGPAQVKTKHLRAYLIHLHEGGKQPATVARARSALRTFFAFLVDEGIVAEDPAADLGAPSGWRRVPRALTIEEATALIESVQGDGPLDQRDRALLELAYGTGARASELLALRLDDCGWEEHLVKLIGKGSRVRLVPLGEPAMGALLAYTERGRPLLAARRSRTRKRCPTRVQNRGQPLQVRGQEPAQIFLNARGGPLTRMGFWKILKKRAAAAGLAKRVYPHLLRHSYATHLLRGGASLRVVQELLGHARLATTQIYTSVDEPYLEAMHRRYHPRGGWASQGNGHEDGG